MTDHPWPSAWPLVKQQGRYDCLQAAIAMVLGLPIGDVPDFMEKARLSGADAATDLYDQLRAWCAPRHLVPLPLQHVAPLDVLLAVMHERHPGVPSILSGHSKWDTGHSVVCYGGRIVHDPMPGYGPDDGGVVKPFPNTGAFEVLYFVALPGVASGKALQQ